MFLVILIICLVSAGLSFISFLIGLRKPSKRGQRISYVIAATLFLTTIASGWFSYKAGIDTEDQVQLARDQRADTIIRVDKAQEQITEIRTPRRMEPETSRMLAARLRPFAGQKYDMKVFRDQDSLELATAVQAILEEAGWVYTNVYPKYAAKRYPETREHGVWLMSHREETIGTYEARKAFRRALEEVGLYDDSTNVRPISCVSITGPLEPGAKLTHIPCSESSIQSSEVFFSIHDDVIPADTLVLHVGKERV